jgi:hypothetical protein
MRYDSPPSTLLSNQHEQIILDKPSITSKELNRSSPRPFSYLSSHPLVSFHLFSNITSPFPYQRTHIRCDLLSHYNYIISISEYHYVRNERQAKK